MKKIEKIINKTNLLYYEFDKVNKKFVVDKKYSRGDVYSEFIKLTYELSKNCISFLVDEHYDIVIASEDSCISRLKQRIKNLFYALKARNKNIYILSNKYVEHAKNLPFIGTFSIDTEVKLNNYDALIFSSKNGVRYLNQLTDKWTKIPSYAISTETAKVIKDLGGNLKFVGKKKYGDEFAKELIPELKGKKVAYMAAKEVVSDLVNILNSNDVECAHFPIYKTECVKYEEKINLPQNSIIIFSSPSTIKCFFKNVHWEPTFTAICIGKTTAKYFPEDIKYIMSDNTTLQSCVQKALSL